MRRLGPPLVFAASLAAAPASAAPVEVTVEGVEGARGAVLVAVCARERFGGAGCAHRARADARTGRVVLALDVPPGLWAVQSFHDLDGDGDLDRSLFGFPREPLGFSNGVEIEDGPPDFDAAAIRVAPEGATTTVRLRRY
ncbi:MAG: DUF2141 domain-containing protein [Paracoccaceae bacterium]